MAISGLIQPPFVIQLLHHLLSKDCHHLWSITFIFCIVSVTRVARRSSIIMQHIQCNDCGESEKNSVK